MYEDEEIAPEYSPDDLKKFRDDYINNHFLKSAKNIFNDHEDVNSIVLCLAQYWDDEASDAVHAKLIPSSFTSSFSSWEDLFDPKKNIVLKSKKLEITKSYISKYSPFFTEKYELPYLDNDETMIQAFGSFCKEGSSQEDDHFDCFTPYAIAIRDENYPNGIKLKTFEKFLPWI